ncbi:uncharacterized protein BDZ99DRAFT_519438 [Mytilinidion resinicola]|uniref:Uncharacterized protein n=1 Tax=Mytilinidion resinicola TaxID=574789 RepID=A0A6A6YS13_9PEZI|nr:uncharacterized protein BDZ99DRAFT_519438 [Mytilinidion resinicola]KAF2810755.1 hypothetical protein BDZ99DRAFT_519438 [Mytilinidion resinicola]
MADTDMVELTQNIDHMDIDQDSKEAWPTSGELILKKNDRECRYCAVKGYQVWFGDVNGLFNHIMAKHVHPKRGDMVRVHLASYMLTSRGLPLVNYSNRHWKKMTKSNSNAKMNAAATRSHTAAASAIASESTASQMTASETTGAQGTTSQATASQGTNSQTTAMELQTAAADPQTAATELQTTATDPQTTGSLDADAQVIGTETAEAGGEHNDIQQAMSDIMAAMKKIENDEKALGLIMQEAFFHLCLHFHNARDARVLAADYLDHWVVFFEGWMEGYEGTDEE